MITPSQNQRTNIGQNSKRISMKQILMTQIKNHGEYPVKKNTPAT